MKIYKFKDLREESVHNHLFQIIDENKVWCASPESLNDDKEFDFKMDYRPTENTGILLMKMLEKLGKSKFPPNMTASYAIINNKLEEFAKPLVGGIVKQCRSTIGVTSFSTVGSDSWLWEEYGGEGNGAVVEFELPESAIGKTFHPVDYVSERIFHVDIFLESQTSGSSKIFRKILCTKTDKWKDEEEIRFLGKTPNVNITFEAPVTGVTIGNNVSASLAKELESRCRKREINVYHQ